MGEGAVVIALTLAAALYGIISAQTLIYIRLGCRDRLALKVIVRLTVSRYMPAFSNTSVLAGYYDLVRAALNNGCTTGLNWWLRRGLESAHIVFVGFSTWYYDIVNRGNMAGAADILVW